MKLLFTVDQAAALRSGINAPSSTVDLEVDPTTLAPMERAVLAAVLWRGHDCRWLGIQTEPDEIVGQRIDAYNTREGAVKPELYANGDPTGPLVLVRPDIDGLRAAIADMLLERDGKRSARREAAEKKQRERDAQIEREIVPREEPLRLYVLEESHQVAPAFAPAAQHVRADIPVRHMPWVSSSSDASPSARERYERARAEASAAREAAVDAAVPGLREQLRRELAEKATKEAAEKAEYDVLYSRLPQSLRDRNASGFATSEEVETALKKLARTEAGYPHGWKWEHSEPTKVLTDAEFARLAEEKARAPSGATFDVLEVWDDAPTPCAEHEGVEDDCSECGVLKKNIRRVVRITWARAGLKIRAVVTLGGEN